MYFKTKYYYAMHNMPYKICHTKYQYKLSLECNIMRKYLLCLAISYHFRNTESIVSTRFFKHNGKKTLICETKICKKQKCRSFISYIRNKALKFLQHRKVSNWKTPHLFQNFDVYDIIAMKRLLNQQINYHLIFIRKQNAFLTSQ